ncbi:uncharacterized protein LOC110808780 isoform X2 [Carica papaya]|uniref:uncharacterized protein LOC110808780 isoform X2 n=1 Tax=Carica papaya TaxID=3649 RepID=UPI000B8CA146|nr:uncharacterized protein LOC110808780 isoform X2 [Carica papaya]
MIKLQGYVFGRERSRSDHYMTVIRWVVVARGSFWRRHMCAPATTCGGMQWHDFLVVTHAFGMSQCGCSGVGGWWRAVTPATGTACPKNSFSIELVKLTPIHPHFK